MSGLLNLRIWTLKLLWDQAQCQSAAPIYIDVLLNGGEGSDLGISTVTNFSRQILPSPFDNSTEGELCEWWTENWAVSATNTTTFISDINSCCNKEICDQVDFGGNADIAGIGVSKSLCKYKLTFTNANSCMLQMIIIYYILLVLVLVFV
jgi:hypothetical protein